MILTMVTVVLGALAAVPPANAVAPAEAKGFDAPVLVVDRFSDEAGTLFRRSQDPSLPRPGEPIDFDRAPFAFKVQGPDGKTRACYNLDVRPATPARYYVFYDALGNYQLGQFPVVDVAPGDPGYSDVWDIFKVFVPNGFRPENNAIRDRATVEKLLADPNSGYTAQRTGILLNGPIVPEGSRAAFKADGRQGSATQMWAWYRGKRAPYLYFEGSIRAVGEQAPVATLQVGAPAKGSPPSSLAAALASGARAAKADAAPRSRGYSPLRRVVGPDGRPVLDGALNCPIVGTGD